MYIHIYIYIFIYIYIYMYITSQDLTRCDKNKSFGCPRGQVRPMSKHLHSCPPRNHNVNAYDKHTSSWRECIRQAHLIMTWMHTTSTPHHDVNVYDKHTSSWRECIRQAHLIMTWIHVPQHPRGARPRSFAPTTKRKHLSLDCTFRSFALLFGVCSFSSVFLFKNCETVCMRSSCSHCVCRCTCVLVLPVLTR